MAATARSTKSATRTTARAPRPRPWRSSSTPTPPPTDGAVAATTAEGKQALKTTAFTLTVANGGTAGFEPSGHLLVDTISNGTQLVAYTGLNAATNAFTGCTAPANAGTAADGANVKQAATVVGAPALTQTPFTLNVSKNVG